MYLFYNQFQQLRVDVRRCAETAGWVEPPAAAATSSASASALDPHLGNPSSKLQWKRLPLSMINFQGAEAALHTWLIEIGIRQDESMSKS